MNEDNIEIPDKDLVELAIEAMENGYAPYSKFKVGAALVTKDYYVFTGVNVENASYGLSVCAERVAVLKAVSEGHTSISKMAIVSSSGEKTFPCGACRQVLHEFSDGMQIIVAEGNGVVTKKMLEELLPHSFGRGDLFT